VISTESEALNLEGLSTLTSLSCLDLEVPLQGDQLEKICASLPQVWSSLIQFLQAGELSLVS
jgi:hypothetical protein